MTESAAATPKLLSNPQVYALTFASAVVTANAYYIHPIISLVAEDFGIDKGMIGIVPAMNQIALAIGIFLLLPLGDLSSNKRLTAIFVAAQTASIAAMAFAPGFTIFLLGSTVLGFFTIAPYLLPTYASKRVPPERLGYVTALLTTGIILGILLARVGAGVVAEYLGWRTIYYIAAALMLTVSILLPLIMDSGERAKDRLSVSKYAGLLGSIGPIIKANPEILISGAIQGLSFGIFLAIWMGLGLHIPDNLGYGVDTVGYLAMLAIVSMVTTPRFGKWADRTGARPARLILCTLQFGIMTMFLITGHSLWLLIVPLVLTNTFGPSIDVTGRMTFLSKSPDIRTRLMTVYIVLMFIGGGFGSWMGTASYAWGGWQATAWIIVAMSALVWCFAFWGYRQFEPKREV